MNSIDHEFEQNERDHSAARKETGFWGEQGAGCIIMARESGRILLAHRSEDVEQPGTYAGFGGAIDNGLSPTEAVRKEVQEESGAILTGDLITLLVFRSGTFRYYNFLALVEDEFVPDLNWESQGFKWCEYGNWPQPLHFGLVSLFKDPDSVATIRKHVAKFAK